MARGKSRVVKLHGIEVESENEKRGREGELELEVLVQCRSSRWGWFEVRNEIDDLNWMGVVKGSSLRLRESIERKLNGNELDRRIGVEEW